MPSRFRMFAIVPRATSCPRLESAPRMRVYTPAGVLTCHSHDEFLDCPHHARPARTSTQERPLHRDQLPMPAEQRVRRDDRIELEELLAADYLRMPSKESAFSVGEDNPPTTETRLQHPVLGLEVFDEAFLLSGEPRSERDDQILHQRRRLEHGASLPQAVASCSLDLDSVSGHYGVAIQAERGRAAGPATLRSSSATTVRCNGPTRASRSTSTQATRKSATTRATARTVSGTS